MLRIAPLRRALLSEARSGNWGAGWALLCVALPTLARIGLERVLPAAPPFLTYFPAVMIAALFLGTGWGLAVLFVSAVVANYYFIPPLQDWALSGDDLGLTSLYIVAGGLMVATAHALRLSLRETAAASAREKLLNAELAHRVKNNLAVVQALAHQTAREAADAQAFHEAFQGRLMALSKAHDVLSTGNWSEGRLPDLAQAALRPFAQGGAVSMTGPHCQIPAAACIPLVLALHELATNAMKYGALSQPGGRVAVEWALSDGVLNIQWTETGGPPVQPPTRKGFGNRLLRQQGGFRLVELDFRPEGLVCRLAVDQARPEGVAE